MSSLKDWYRYVDSKARSRPEEAAAAERDRAAAAGLPPAEAAADRGDPFGGEAGGGEEAGAVSGLAAGEEGLDVWGGLFPHPQKPEPKPTTAPLRRPAARLDEIPPDLPFARTPVDGPPPPQFELPEAEVAIPRFDDFVAPFTAGTAPTPVVGGSPPSTPASSSPPEPPAAAISAPSLSGEPPGPSAASVGAAASEEGPPPSDPERSPSMVQEEVVPQEPAPSSDMWGGEDLEGEAGQLRWRSPFRLPGPGRTVSSGAPSPKPDPVVPRPVASFAPAEEQERREEAATEGTPARPAPGTEAWERERVERLARTFRDTLRALEESLGAPRPPVTEPPAGETVAVAPSSFVESPPPAAALADAAPALPSAALVEAESPPTVESRDARELAAPSLEPSRLARAPAAAEAGIPVEEAPEPDHPAVQDPLRGYPPRRPVSSATPDVLRNIEEAALIRQRLPQHMAMLLRIPTNEVAQNSYKSPFRESREDLIGRLLDPQLTLEEAARILGVCPTTVRRYTNRGMLHCHRTPGNQRRFRMSDVLQFLEQYGDRIDRAAEAKAMEPAG